MSNPVGKALSVNEVEVYVNDKVGNWQDENNTPGFFSKIFSGSQNGVVQLTKFLMDSVDDLIHLAEKLAVPGADKKATVIAAITRIYDLAIIGMLPLWAKPFAPAIRYVVLDVIVDNSIDWIVGKYRDGSWNAKA